MTTLLSIGIALALLLVLFCLVKWWNLRNVGVTPVHLFTFIAILFTSGLDVGLIMFPLTEFPVYADTATAPEYGFANPLAIEFGFWGFLIWAFYFLTAFYFCIVEPRVRFFEKPVVKIVNNAVIIGTCAFTGYLFLTYLPWYASGIIGDGETLSWHFYAIVLATIALAAYSSTDIKYVRILSLASTWLFFALILGMALAAAMGIDDLFATASLAGEYFTNIHKFVLPLNDYHQFYLFWWFAWSIMIGQFTSRFVGGLKTWQVFVSLLVFPSIPLLIWFSVLHFYWANELATGGLIAISMLVVGVTFVINSLDSLIRLYTDNLGLTTERLGRLVYLGLNVAVLFGLVLLFKSGWMQIEWIGSVVIGIYFACVIYIALFKRREVMAITASPEDRDLDFQRIETVH
ncbi:BCCT family transporter [Shimia sp.]|uniref:BCCT family transporter n=1 Tax=Shimia sp. TaxID=1954381 RepID=UPI003566A437